MKKIFEKIIKNKVIVIIISIIIVSGGTVAFWLLISNSVDNRCIVDFDTSGGTKITSKEVACGKIIEEPTKPEKEGFEFKYWLYNGDMVKFEEFKITESITISAYWEAKEGIEIVNIHFNTNGGSSIDDIEILKGNSLTEPRIPIKEGYKFKYWMLNENKFDFETKLEEDITLVAKWELIATENQSNNSNNSSNANSNTTSNNHLPESGYYTLTHPNGIPIYGYASGRNDRCSASFRSDVLEKDIEEGYKGNINELYFTNSSWSTNANECYRTYKTSNKQVATISSSGEITAKNIGTTYVYECFNDTATKKELVCFKGKLNVKKADKIEYVPVESINCMTSGVMEIGETQVIQFEILPNNYSPTTFHLSSSDESIVNIINQDKREVKALKSGEVTMKLESASGIEETCIIKVLKKEILVEKISLSDYNMILGKGEGHSISAVAFPEDATNKEIIWTTSDSSVAKIENGMIVGVGKGEAVIKAISKDGNASASCKVTVTYDGVEEVKLNKNSISLYVFETETLKATVLPENARDKRVSFISSNESVAKVDSNGLVTAVGKGTSTITVITEDGSFRDTCTVNVKTIPVTGINLNTQELNLINGEVNQLIAIVTPTNAYNKQIIWSSTNTNVATVNSNGLVTAVGKGTTTITATTEDGGYKTTCVVNVRNILVTGINLNTSNMTIQRGESIKIDATILPINATNKNINWTSTNKNVATVDSNGLVTAVGKGTTTITATTEDGGYSASIEVTSVNKPLHATAKVQFKTAVSEIVYGTEVVVSASGGSLSYTYDIKLYKDGVFILKNSDQTLSSLFAFGKTGGNFHAEITVKDTEGEEYSFKTDTVYIEDHSGFIEIQ